MFYGKRLSKTIEIGSHRVLLRLEPRLWADIEEITQREGISEAQLWPRIFEGKPEKLSFAQAVRGFIVTYFRHDCIKKCMQARSLEEQKQNPTHISGCLAVKEEGVPLSYLDD